MVKKMGAGLSGARDYRAFMLHTLEKFRGSRAVPGKMSPFAQKAFRQTFQLN